MKYGIFNSYNPFRGMGMKIGEIRECGGELSDWFGAGIGLFLIIAVPYSIISGIYELLEEAIETGIYKLIIIGFVMIVLELIISRFRWYGILCAMAMYGALLQLPSAIKNGITWDNVNKEDVSVFFAWFIIPVVIGIISHQRKGS